MSTTAIVAILLLIPRTGQTASVARADAPGDAKAVKPIPFPDGVLDAERRTIYVTSPKGGIQGIRLEDGKVLWTNDACTGQPWLVAGQRLIVRGDRIAALDLKK